MNYGTYGRDLLLELKRTDTASTTTAASTSSSSNNSNPIPPYNDVLVGSALQDIKLHIQALNEQVEAATRSSANRTESGKPSMEVRPSLMLQEVAIQRNKRCLLAYHFHRIQRIQQYYYWQSSSSSTSSVTGQSSSSSNLENLNPAEVEYLNEYNTMISKYIKSTIPDSLGIDDLRTYAVMPPLTVDRVVVRVLDTTPFGDDGPIVLESGQTVTFTLGSTHYLQYTDVEAYIRSGALQLIETEENEG